MLATPGEAHADIAVGEGQPLGIPLSYGGPYLGLFASRMEHARQMPGRIAGIAYDDQGRRGYVMSLQAREQHIRRERATSNICTNQGLCALAVCVHLAALGRRGLMRLARLNAWRARQSLTRLESIPGVRRAYAGAFFNEFVVELPVDAMQVCRILSERGVLAGLPLSRFYPELGRQLLVCATEMTRPADIEALATALESTTTTAAAAGRGVRD
jgi:glycine dehydrogenase subunit 1